MVFLLYCGYFVVVIWVAHFVGIWDTSIMRETVLWFVMAGATLFTTFTNVGRYPRLLTRRFLALLGVGAFLEYFFDLVSFSLWIEIPLVFVMTILLATLEVAARSVETRAAATFFSGVIVLIVVAVLIGTAVDLVRHRNSMDYRQLGMSFGLIFWLPAVVIPAVYVLGLLSAYEQLALQLKWRDPVRLRTRFLAAAAVLRMRPRLVYYFKGAWVARLAEQPDFRSAREQVRAYRRAHRQSLLERNANRCKYLKNGRQRAGIDVDAGVLGISVEQPPGWEWLLYAAALRDLMDGVDEHRRERAIGARMLNGPLRTPKESVRETQVLLDGLPRAIAALEDALNLEKQDAAFGLPGEPGDPDGIIELAGELAGGYADLWERYERFDSLDVRPHNPAIVSLREASARFAQEPAEQVRAFVDRLVAEMEDIPDRLARGQRIEIQLTLKLELSDETLRGHDRALQMIADAHRKSQAA